MSTFLHYVHCKDALLDCSAPGGERCESLTSVDEIRFRYIECLYDARQIDDYWVDCEETKHCGNNFRINITNIDAEKMPTIFTNLHDVLQSTGCFATCDEGLWKIEHMFPNDRVLHCQSMHISFFSFSCLNWYMNASKRNCLSVSLAGWLFVCPFWQA